jgi:hypothetical protein
MHNFENAAHVELYPANQGIEIHYREDQNPILLQMTAYHPGAFIPTLYIRKIARDLASNCPDVIKARKALEEICQKEIPVFQDGKPAEIPEYWTNQILKVLKVSA